MMKVTIYLNVTTHEQAHERGTAGRLGFSPGHAASPAIFLRGHGDGDKHAAKGDRLVTVGTYDLTADTVRGAAEEAYAFGNGAREDSQDYYDSPVRPRSFSTGDVVVVETPDGPATMICESWGWESYLDLADFEVTA